MIQTLAFAAIGVAVLAGIVLMFVRSRRADMSDSVPQNVLTRINAEYRDIH
jgi:hypothetical protein